MKKETLTLWSMPVEVAGEVVEALEKAVCTRVSLGQYELAESILYSLKHLKNDYEELMTKLEETVENEEG